ncbi:unnamed protein product [Ectocarpus sp. CCAP 1310/34]|nr:unnamed protein product [Ectocarpus sp. CCAP 1310/34]
MNPENMPRTRSSHILLSWQLKRPKRIEHLLHLTLPLNMNWVNRTWRQMLGAVERKLSAKCVACGRTKYHHVSEMGGPGGWGQRTNSRRQCDGIG